MQSISIDRHLNQKRLRLESLYHKEYDLHQLYLANGLEFTMGDTNAIVRSEVVETGFGFYFDKDIKHLSCCKITSTLTEDALGHSLPK